MRWKWAYRFPVTVFNKAVSGIVQGKRRSIIGYSPPLSLEIVPEVFAKVNSAQFSSCFLRGELEGGMGPIRENTHVNRKWGFLPFHISWRQQICIAKILFSYEDDSPEILNQPLPNDAKSPLPVDVRRWKHCCLSSLIWWSSIPGETAI